MKYALYTGCAAKGACPELYQSTMLVTKRLGLEVVEMLNAACCGAGVITEADPDLALAINARTFAQAEALGLNIMTICGTCQGVMAMANHRLKTEEGLLDRINGLLEPEGVRYNGGVEVKHLLWIIVGDIGLDTLRGHVTVPLENLRIAPFYGCYILRPSKYLGFDDPENPVSLEKLISALSAHPVDYEGRTKCCGFPLVLEKEPIAIGMVGAHVKEAKDELADAMVTPCPLCHMNLDIYQDRAGKKIGGKLALPILHLPQLIGLAMGFKAKELGLSRHLIPTKSVVEKIQLKV
ncbi:MAG TPA: CoB--CoM heterodisulfide reductase iron-sulfur subunit B family protein [Nitrospiria bacterium]|jgi:succinate dehydrogenase / fumarate reductase cytochrome b subunit|nr:CoB--CoM heterodisulfide reductase iron-sulfur subunit B family protein [Nitrospiria bacterium]